MAVPTYDELKAYLDSGRTQLDAAAEFGLSRSRVQRIIKAGEDRRGPVERAVDGLIAKRARDEGGLDAAATVRAEMLRAAAGIVDASRQSHTGVAWSAGVAALERLRQQVAEFEGPNTADRAWLADVFAQPGGAS